MNFSHFLLSISKKTSNNPDSELARLVDKKVTRKGSYLPTRSDFTHVRSLKNQNQNYLLVIRLNENPSPRPVIREVQ